MRQSVARCCEAAMTEGAGVAMGDLLEFGYLVIWLSRH
jgi:hypothetical protein